MAYIVVVNNTLNKVIQVSDITKALSVHFRKGDQ